MKALLTLFTLVLCVIVLMMAPSDGSGAIIVCLPLAIISLLIISRSEYDAPFLMRLFVGGLLIRLFIGTLIYFFSLQAFFGGDALSYDIVGYALGRGWHGDNYYQEVARQYIGKVGGNGWGMIYYVAVLYEITGRNLLATQFVNSIMGAATAPVIALCAWHIFKNHQVARISGLFAAFFPSLVLWSSQGLKDGPIVFFLALSMLATLKLGEKVSLKYLVVLTFALFSLLSMRFYVFYMMVSAVVGAFVIGMRPITVTSFLRQFVIIIILGLALTYAGILRYATLQYQTFGSLEAVQVSREDLASTGQSGFARDVDVSTTQGALMTIPIGLLYLILAPFPWQLANLRQSITLPEMIVWWVSVPFLMLGLWFTLKYRLRQVSPILIFISMLTLLYSLFQGNVGTAYRQRSQLLVFYFIFAAVGFVLFKEHRQEKARQDMAEREALAAQRAAAQAWRTQPRGWKNEAEALVGKEQREQVEGR